MKLAALALLAPVLLAQPKPGTIEGAVLNSANGAPVPHATLSIAGTRDYSRVTTADDAGKFRFADLEPGPYRVEYVAAPGYVYQPPTLQAFTVAEDQHVQGVSLELLPFGVIGGRVVDEDGDPIPGVQIAIMQFQSVTSGKGHTADGAITDDRGMYRAFHLRPGRYFVNAWLPPGKIQYGVLQKDWMPPNTHRDAPEMGYLPVFYPTGADVSQASPINLAPGAQLGGIDFRLRGVPVFHIRGRLTGAPSGRQTSVLASPCHAPPGAAEYGAALGRDDHFDIAGVSSGVYCLTLWETGFTRTRYVNDTVTVSDRNLDGVELHGLAAFPVSGVLRFENLSGDVPDVAVFLAPAPDNPVNPIIAQVPEGGKFVLEGSVPGAYRVQVNRLPPNFYLKSVQIGDQESPDAMVTLHPGGGALTVVVGADAGQLTVTVETDKARSAPITVSMAPSGSLANRGDLLRSMIAGPDGRAMLLGLPPGEYKVYAWDDPHPPFNVPEVLQEFSSRAATVTITAGGSTTTTVKAIPADEIAKAQARF